MPTSRAGIWGSNALLAGHSPPLGGLACNFRAAGRSLNYPEAIPPSSFVQEPIPHPGLYMRGEKKRGDEARS